MFLLKVSLVIGIVISLMMFVRGLLAYIPGERGTREHLQGGMKTIIGLLLTVVLIGILGVCW